MQSLLLIHHSWIFQGSRETFVQLQFYRNVLITFCRRLLSQDGTILRLQQRPQRPDDTWLEWVRGEAERRILYFTWSKNLSIGPGDS
jgi:hypothetical protein